MQNDNVYKYYYTVIVFDYTLIFKYNYTKAIQKVTHVLKQNTRLMEVY